MKDISLQILEEVLEEGKLGRIAKAGMKAAVFGGMTFANVVQKRINSMHYQCQSIKNPNDKIKCRINLLKFVIAESEKALKDPNIDSKKKEKLIRSIGLFKEQKEKLHQKAMKLGFKYENTDISEAATGGWWKSLLAPISTAMLTQSRIEKGFYYCNDLPRGETRNGCMVKMLQKTLSELEKAKRAEQYNPKIDKKIQEVKERIMQMRKKI